MAGASPSGNAAPYAVVHPASGGSTQWAFGGVASYSCTTATCLGGATSNLSLSLSYYIEWVVIYTQTNVSSTQTMIEGQTALNASLNLHLSECVPQGTGPCKTLTVDLTASGKETAVGFTNVTSSGSVDLTSAPSGPLGPTAALAVMNAASHEAFNFSATETESGLNATPGGPTTLTANIDVGAQESSSVNFASPLGLLPLNPVPGDAWSSNASFTASGSWSGGYSISSPVSGGSFANWTSGTITPSGTVFVNGTDLGAYTLYDNYTNPATSVTAQEILLDFGNDSFSAADGWVMVPSALYGGPLGFLGSGTTGLAHVAPAAHLRPAALGTTSITSSENAYYEQGAGIVGVSAAGSASVGGTSSPNVNLRAGPEPVSVAEQQYNAITSGGGSPGSSFPWTIVVVAAVVVVAAIALAALTVGRRRRRSAAGVAPSAGPTAASGVPGAPAAPAGGPTPPSAGAAAAAPMGSPAGGPNCPSCGQPTTYVAQYGRYYCYSEGKYL
ncbi:MAG TPA: hypothetical protein VGU43_06005 [Thermoplasmata archaeon]|nr:hypothetical protein [Thermoplasmata archaeon]